LTQFDLDQLQTVQVDLKITGGWLICFLVMLAKLDRCRHLYCSGQLAREVAGFTTIIVDHGIFVDL
jgi:hypothetical protein